MEFFLIEKFLCLTYEYVFIIAISVVSITIWNRGHSIENCYVKNEWMNERLEQFWQILSCHV